MKTKLTIALTTWMSMAACHVDADLDDTDTQETDADDDERAGPWCPMPSAPAPDGMLGVADLQRIEALPYFASAVLDVRGTERLGTTSLTVEPDGRKVLRVVTSDRTLTRTYFAELDVTDVLGPKNGGLFAQDSSKNGTLGSISANGEDGAFFQGGIASARFFSQPSGVFVLELEPSQIEMWPPEVEPGQAEAATIAALSEKVRIVGRLTGVCLGTLPNGSVGRIMDVTSRPECDALIGGL